MSLETVKWYENFNINDEDFEDVEITCCLEGSSNEGYSLFEIWVAGVDSEVEDKILSYLWNNEDETLSKALNALWN